MALFFSITTPSGIAIGIGITNIYKDTSPTALIIEGVFNSASAGILIYMALVDLLSADFMSPKMQSNGKLQLGANISLLIGAGCMSLLAKWAWPCFFFFANIFFFTSFHIYIKCENILLWQNKNSRISALCVMIYWYLVCYLFVHKLMFEHGVIFFIVLSYVIFFPGGFWSLKTEK